MSLWNDYFDDYHAEPEAFIEAGDRVVGLLWLRGRNPTTGEPIGQQVGAIYADFGPDGPREVRFFTSWAEAKAVAGLNRIARCREGRSNEESG
jgi:hypothetical protein